MSDMELKEIRKPERSRSRSPFDEENLENQNS